MLEKYSRPAIGKVNSNSRLLLSANVFWYAWSAATKNSPQVDNLQRQRLACCQQPRRKKICR
jgi:hypothetical protein